MNPYHFSPVVLELTISLSIYVLGLAATRRVCVLLTPPEGA